MTTSWINLYEIKDTYLSSSARSLKTDDTDNSGILLYCVSSGTFCYELSRCIINYDP